jgi:hypothetical protein
VFVDFDVVIMVKRVLYYFSCFAKEGFLSFGVLMRKWVVLALAGLHLEFETLADFALLIDYT